jgi:hypothetical protein
MTAWKSTEAFQGISDPPKFEKRSGVIGRSPLLADRSPKKRDEH